MPRGICEMKEKPAELRSVDERSFLQRRGSTIAGRRRRMSRQTINLFMWGYQPHFRTVLQLRARDVLNQIGLDIDPTVLLVGVRGDGVTDRHPLCIEPEDESPNAFTATALATKSDRHSISQMRSSVFGRFAAAPIRSTATMSSVRCSCRAVCSSNSRRSLTFGWTSGTKLRF